MVHEMTGVTKHLSKNIFALRRARGLSQGGLAKIAAVPRSTVTYLESGTGNPSLQNVLRVADALQVGVEELLKKPRANGQLIKKDEIPTQKRAGGMAILFKLLPDPIPGMELDRMVLQPNCRMGGVPHTANTKEYMVCVSGQIEVSINGTKYTARSGDVLAFAGDQPHSYFNPGKIVAEAVSVVVLAPHGV